MSTQQSLQNCQMENGTPAETRNQNQVSPLQIRPAVDLVETADGFVMSVEMPGVDSSGVEVSIEQNVLTVEGRTEFAVPENARRITGDVGPRVYRRQFQLTDDIDRDGIDAEVRHGVLTLKFNKSNRARRAVVPVRGESNS